MEQGDDVFTKCKNLKEVAVVNEPHKIPHTDSPSIFLNSTKSQGKGNKIAGKRLIFNNIKEISEKNAAKNR